MKKPLKVKIKEKTDTIVNKIRDGAWNVTYWVVANKDIVIAVTPIIVGGITGATKMISAHNRTKRLKVERENKKLYCYDPRLGCYYHLRRPLSGKDWIQIDKRKSNGERLGDILESMKALR